MNQLARPPIGRVQALPRHQPPGDLARDQGSARRPQSIQNQARAFSWPEPSVAATHGFRGNIARFLLWGEQPEHGINVNQISAHLSKTLFQVRNLTGQFRPLVAKSADDMSLGHDLSP